MCDLLFVFRTAPVYLVELETRKPLKKLQFPSGPRATVHSGGARFYSGRCKIYNNSKNTKNHAFKAILLAKYMPVMTDEMLRADAVKDLLYEYIYGKVPCIL